MHRFIVQNHAQRPATLTAQDRIQQYTILESVSPRLRAKPTQVSRYELAADFFVDVAVEAVFVMVPEMYVKPPPRPPLLPVGATVTALAAPVASGTGFFPVPISTMLESAILKRALPMLTSSLSRSKTM